VTQDRHLPPQPAHQVAGRLVGRVAPGRAAQSDNSPIAASPRCPVRREWVPLRIDGRAPSHQLADERFATPARRVPRTPASRSSGNLIGEAARYAARSRLRRPSSAVPSWAALAPRSSAWTMRRPCRFRPRRSAQARHAETALRRSRSRRVGPAPTVKDARARRHRRLTQSASHPALSPRPPLPRCDRADHAIPLRSTPRRAPARRR